MKLSNQLSGEERKNEDRLQATTDVREWLKSKIGKYIRVTGKTSEKSGYRDGGVLFEVTRDKKGMIIGWMYQPVACVVCDPRRLTQVSPRKNEIIFIESQGKWSKEITIEDIGKLNDKTGEIIGEE